MNVTFGCPECDYPGKASVPGPMWKCPNCDHVLPLREPVHVTNEEGIVLQSCAVCDNHELYKMKGFPHWLGLSILTIACIAFLVLHGYYQPTLAWAILLISAAFDGILYLLVPDVVTCYRCGTRHGGLKHVGNDPFELTTHERYRHEKAQ